MTAFRRQHDSLDECGWAAQLHGICAVPAIVSRFDTLAQDDDSLSIGESDDLRYGLAAAINNLHSKAR